MHVVRRYVDCVLGRRTKRPGRVAGRSVGQERGDVVLECRTEGVAHRNLMAADYDGAALDGRYFCEIDDERAVNAHESGGRQVAFK